MSKSRADRINEKYLAKKKKFEDDNKSTLCMIHFISTIATVGLAVGTVYVLNVEDYPCKGYHVRLTLWLMLMMHATNILESVCQLTGLSKIFCGCMCTLMFFLYELGVLVYMQSIFYSSGECRVQTPKQYWWLLVNIIIYFGFFFATCYIQIKSCLAAPSEKDAEEELKEEEKAGATPNTLQ